MKFKVNLKENKYINEAESEVEDTSIDQYLEQLNKLLQRVGSEVSKDFKILIAIKNKAVQDDDFKAFWNALNKILLFEKNNSKDLEKIFPGIFGAARAILSDIKPLMAAADIGNEISTSINKAAPSLKPRLPRRGRLGKKNRTENISFHELAYKMVNENEKLTSNVSNLLDKLKTTPKEDQEKIIKALQNNIKLSYDNVEDSLKNNNQIITNFKKWVINGLERLHKEPRFESDIKKQHPQGWPIVFFVQNQQYVESLQTIYAALHIITAFRDDMVKLAAAVDNKFDGITRSVGSRIDRLPAEKPRQPGDPVIQEEVEMVDAPEIELNPAAAADEPGKGRQINYWLVFQIYKNFIKKYINNLILNQKLMKL